MKLHILSILIVFFIISQNTKAQIKNESIYIDSKQNIYVKSDAPLYFYIATDTISQPQRVDIFNRKNPQKKYMQISKNGIHHLKHFNVNENAFEEIIINVDGLSPKTSFITSSFAKYANKGIICYGKNAKIHLSAVDNMSKVKNTYYSINDSAFQEYIDSLPFYNSGNYNLVYYSIDNVGNKEEPNRITFEVDIESPLTEYIIEGPRLDTIFNSHTKLKLKTNDNYIGVENTYYQIDGGKWNLYNKKNIPINILEDDEHTLAYYSVDRVQNKEPIKKFRFYLDKKPPLASLISLGDKFVLKNKIYFSGRTKLVLIALDNKSGVDSIMYSVDNEKYKPYKDAFYLPAQQGVHLIKYFAVDKLGNKGAGGDEYSVYQQSSDVFIVDLLGPDIYFKIIGKHFTINKRIVLNSKNKISISSIDKESGLKNIKYSIGKDTTELTYSEPIQVSTLLKDSLQSITAIAYDNVNNRNELPFLFIIDTIGPNIQHYFSVKPKNNEEYLPIIPAYAKLFLAAVDNLIGIKNIKYSVNGNRYEKYIKPISKFVKNKIYDIKIIATDKLDNESIYNIKFKTE